MSSVLIMKWPTHKNSLKDSVMWNDWVSSWYYNIENILVDLACKLSEDKTTQVCC